jgi:misacylated tRNA(Ala) deacylase
MEGPAMADLLYHTDAYLKRFDAIVKQVEGQEVALDRTTFFPGGGGQPPDRGMLRQGQRTWPLRRARKRGEDVWHELEGTPPSVGDSIEGVLDWEHRYQIMRTHTAMHILCGVIWRDYRASVTGGNMEPLRGRMDFEFASMHKDLVGEIERKINLEVEKARPVLVSILPREEAFRIPDLIRTKINLLPSTIQQVRVVEISGLDLQADGGTHVANTREVGPLRIVDYLSKGAENKRLIVALQA